MSAKEVLGLLLSYGYAFALLIVMEALGKKRAWPQRVTRKLIHIGAGMWVWGILYFFNQRLWGILPFATFIVLNYWFYRRQTFSQMDDEASTPGTVYFAISITVLFFFLWRPQGVIDYAPQAVAGIMAMTWGDAFASLLGQSCGKKGYRVFGHRRTWLGSAVMFFVSFAAIGLTLWLLPGSLLSRYSVAMASATILKQALIAAAAATVAEACAPAGTDNLTVPLFTSACLLLLQA